MGPVQDGVDGGSSEVGRELRRPAPRCKQPDYVGKVRCDLVCVRCRGPRPHRRGSCIGSGGPQPRSHGRQGVGRMWRRGAPTAPPARPPAIGGSGAGRSGRPHPDFWSRRGGRKTALGNISKSRQARREFEEAVAARARARHWAQALRASLGT